MRSRRQPLEKSDGGSLDGASRRLSAIVRPFSVFLFLTVAVAAILACGGRDNPAAGEVGPTRLPPPPMPLADSVSTPLNATPSAAVGDVPNLGPAVATIVYKDGPFTPKRLDVEVGQTVLYGKYSGTEVTVEGEEYLILRESDILAVLG